MYKVLALIVILAAVANASPAANPGIWDNLKDLLKDKASDAWEKTKDFAHDQWEKIEDHPVVDAITDSKLGQAVDGLIKDIGKKVDEKLD